jgi:hypothetical protein
MNIEMGSLMDKHKNKNIATRKQARRFFITPGAPQLKE